MDSCRINKGKGIMLKLFRFRNSYCYSDWVELDMRTKYEHTELEHLLNDSGLLPVAAIYGKNGGGKSMLLETLRDVALDALGDTFKGISLDSSKTPFKQVISRRRFAVVEDGACEQNGEIEYEVHVVIDGSDYVLKYSIGEKGVLSEKLSQGKKTIYSLKEGVSAGDGDDKLINDTVKAISSRERMAGMMIFPKIAVFNDKLERLHDWFLRVKDGVDFNDGDKKMQQERIAETARRIFDEDDEGFGDRLLLFLQCLDDSIHSIGFDNVGGEKKLKLYHKNVPNDNWKASALMEFDDTPHSLAYSFDDVPKDTSEAVAWYEAESKKGNMKATHNLGLMYHGGLGVEKIDSKQAFDYFEKAANEGLAKAQYFLGYMHFGGHGTPKNLTHAEKWLELSADQGFSRAQGLLGVLYGEQGEIDLAAQFLYYAAVQGLSEAQHLYAIHLEYGVGIEQDIEGAKKWYKKAAEQGNPYAQYEMARISGDVHQEVEWLQKSVNQGNIDAQAMLARFYRMGRGVEKDIEKAELLEGTLENTERKRRNNELGLETRGGEFRINGDGKIAHAQLAVGIPIESESEGTRRLIEIFPKIDKVLQEGLIFICDEMDKALHPIAFKHIVRMFCNPKINKNNAQLIFVAHDTFALDSGLLRRDCVHIADKGEFSESIITRLSEIPWTQPYANMEHEFRMGYYGSVPENIYSAYEGVGDAITKD